MDLGIFCTNVGLFAQVDPFSHLVKNVFPGGFGDAVISRL